MAEYVLVTRALTKRYGAAAAVDGVDLAVEKGQIYGLVGRNGAGKTTIIRMLTAQTVPTTGEIELFGQATEKGLATARARTGAMVETPSFYPYLTARENLEYYRENARVITDTLSDLGIRFYGGVHSPYVWFECPKDMDSWTFFDYLLQEIQVVGTPGAGFGENGKHYFRLTSFGTYENTAEAMKRFRNLLETK